MYKHILIATDGSELAQKGVERGLALAQSTGARVTAVTVTESFPIHASHRYGLQPGDLERYDQRQAQYAADILGAVKARARELGVVCETLHLADAQPADGIIETAAELQCNLIVMTSHGRRGLQKIILGSQTQEVLARATTPVLVVK